MKKIKIIKIYYQSGEYSTNVRSYCDLLREMFPWAETYITNELNDGIDPDILIVFGSLEWFREERNIHGLTFGCSDYIYVNFSVLKPSDYVIKKITNAFYGENATISSFRNAKSLVFDSKLIYETDIREFGYDCHKYEKRVVSDLADLIYQLNLTDNKVDKIYSSLFKALRSLAGMTTYFNVNGSNISNVYIDLSRGGEE